MYSIDITHYTHYDSKPDDNTDCTVLLTGSFMIAVIINAILFIVHY